MEEKDEQPKVKLDGSYGAGVTSELTIITRTPSGTEREEVFTIPASMVSYESLMFFYKANLILGFKLVKSERFDNELKELGL